MKAISFCVLFFCAFVDALAQKNKVEDQNFDLAKYSYLIFGAKFSNNISEGIQYNFVQGTCFFIQERSTIYLVTAKHTVSGWHSDSSGKSLLYPDTLYVRLTDKNNNFSFFPINISNIKDTIKGLNVHNDPDIFAFEFKYAKQFNINTIESYSRPINSRMQSKINVFGFPSKPNTESDFNAATNEEASLTVAQPISGLNNTLVLNVGDGRKIVDSINYSIQLFDSSQKGGYSGAPVFIQENSGNWHFAGMFVNYSFENQRALVVKPKYLKELINLHQRRKN